MKLLGFLLLALLASLPGQEMASGNILLADPDLPDPNFTHTVVLLVHAGEDGAMGLILNRPAKAAPKNLGRAVYAGGPVEQEFVSALTRSGAKLSGALRIAGDVYMLADRDVLEKRSHASQDAASFRVYLGYAGWGPGQLDQELAAGAWTILPWRVETVFDADPATLWDRLNQKSHLRIARITRSVARVSGLPE